MHDANSRQRSRPARFGLLTFSLAATLVGAAGAQSTGGVRLVQYVESKPGSGGPGAPKIVLPPRPVMVPGARPGTAGPASPAALPDISATVPTSAEALPGTALPAIKASDTPKAVQPAVLPKSEPPVTALPPATLPPPPAALPPTPPPAKVLVPVVLPKPAAPTVPPPAPTTTAVANTLPAPPPPPGLSARPTPPAPPSPARDVAERPAPTPGVPDVRAADGMDVGHLVAGPAEPRQALDLVPGKPTILVLRQTPRRLRVLDETVLTATLTSAKDLTLIARHTGSTVLHLWFIDPADAAREVVVSYVVRVANPVPAAVDPQVSVELGVAKLQEQINRTFPDSTVRLTLVGSQIVLSGQAKDRPEADAILRLVVANTNVSRPRIQPSSLGVNVNLTGCDLKAGAGKVGTLDKLLQTAEGSVVNLIKVPGERQVMLRVTVAEVNRAAARSIGVNFGVCSGFRNKGQTLTPNVTGLPLVLDNGQTLSAINALRGMNLAKSLAEPTLVAIDGETAKFQAGGRFPVPTITGGTAAGLQGVTFVPYGVQLCFTPSVTDRDRIRLQVSAEVSTKDLPGGAMIGGAGVPGVNSRNFNTVVELREGQTMAVAGLIQCNSVAEGKKVPCLGEASVIGRLVGADRTASAEQELVILITPELVHPVDAKDCPPGLPGSDVVAPGDIEFYLKGHLENRKPARR